MKKTIAVTVLTLCIAIFAAGCSAADVVLKYSPGSFAKIVKAYPDIVTDTTKTDYYYSINVDGETTLKISHDYSLTGANDIMITTPLKPFTDAGLDTSKLGVDVKNVSGWTFKTMQNEDGSFVDVLLKAYDLDAK